MPKMKSHRGSRRRFRRTAKGKWIYSKANRSHLAEHKPAKRKRQLRRKGIVNKRDAHRIGQLLPYA